MVQKVPLVDLRTAELKCIECVLNLGGFISEPIDKDWKIKGKNRLGCFCT